jgi:transposase-like protein
MSDLTAEQADVVWRIRLRMAELRTSVPRVESDGVRRCRICGEVGHNRRRHLAMGNRKVRPTKRRRSFLSGAAWREIPRGEQAAYIVANEYVTYQQAADRTGVTQQAVCQAWHRLFGDRKPPRRAALIERNADLVRDAASMTARELAAKYQVTPNSAYAICGNAGIAPRRRYPEAVRAAAVALLAGGASLAEASADSGLSIPTIAREAKLRGVSATATASGRRGRTQRALELVRGGMSVSAASKQARCSTVAIYIARKKLK